MGGGWLCRAGGHRAALGSGGVPRPLNWLLLSTFVPYSGMSSARACPDGRRIFLTVPSCSSCQGPRPQPSVTAALCFCLAPASLPAPTTCLSSQRRSVETLWFLLGRWLSSHRVAGPILGLPPSRALGLLEVVLLPAALPCAPLDVGPRHASCTPVVLFQEWTCCGQQAGSDSQPLG